MTTSIKFAAGARVAVLGQSMDGRETQTRARIVRPDPHLIGYYLVRFYTGGELCVPGSRMRAA